MTHKKNDSSEGSRVASLEDAEQRARRLPPYPEYVRRAIIQFLGDDKIIEIPINRSGDYCDLVIFVLENQENHGWCEMEYLVEDDGDWRCCQEVEIAPVQMIAGPTRGITFMQREGVRLVMDLRRDLTGVDIVISACASRRLDAERFVSAVEAGLIEENLPRLIEKNLP